jgi:hypothetical protein
MSRKKTGTILPTKDGRWQAVITLADGSRKRLEPFAKGMSEAMAREKAAAYSERAHAQGLTRPKPAVAAVLKPAESHEPWLKAWCADPRGEGLHDGGRFDRPLLEAHCAEHW